MNKYINIPGRMHSVATDGQVAGANEIYDDKQHKFQQEINNDLHNEYETLQETLDNLSPDQQEAIALSGKVNALEDKAADLEDRVEGLEDDALRMSEQTLTDEQKAQVQKNIGINLEVDEYPTKDSENLVKSGGVFKVIDELVYSDSVTPNLITIERPVDNIAIVGDYTFPVIYTPEDYTAGIAGIEVHTNVSEEYVTAEMNADNTAVILHVTALPDNATSMRITLNVRFAVTAGTITVSGVSDVIGLNYRYPQIVMEQRAEINDVGEYEYPFHLGPADYDAPISSITPSVNQPSDWVTVRIENSSVFVNVLKQREYDYPIVVGIDVAFENGIHAQGSATTIVTPKYPTFTLTNDDVITEVGDYDFAFVQGEEEGVTAVIASIVPSILSNSETEPVPTVQMVTDSLLRMTVSQAPYNTIKVNVIVTVTFTSGKILPVTCTKDIIGEEGFITSESNPEVMKIISEYTNWSRSTEKITYGECLAVTDLGTVFSQAQAEHPYTPLIPIDPSTMTPQEIADAEAQNVIIEAHNAEASLYHVKHFEELGYFTGLTEIHADAFKGCDELTAVRIPLTITAFRKDCFWGCTALTQIWEQDTVVTSPLKSVVIGKLSNVTLESGAFAYTDIEGAVIPDSMALPSFTNDYVSPFAYTSIKLFGLYGTEANYVCLKGRFSRTAYTEGLSPSIRLDVEYSFGVGFGIVQKRTGDLIFLANIDNKVSSYFNSSAHFGVAGVRTGACVGLHIGCRFYIQGDVGPNAFKDADIKYVNISDCSNIGEYAFANCKNVEFITCTSSAAPTIYEHTFENCGSAFNGLKYLNILDGATGYDSGGWQVVTDTLGYTIDYPVITSTSNPEAFKQFELSRASTQEYAFFKNALFKSDARIAFVGEALIPIIQSTSSNWTFDELQYFTGITSFRGFYFYSRASYTGKLTHITIPPSVSTLNWISGILNAGHDGIRLSELTIPNTVSIIQTSALQALATDILNVEGNPAFVPHVLSADRARFTAPTYCTEINLPQSTIDKFIGLKSSTVTRVYAPLIKNIPNNAFNQCSALEDYDFTNVESIGTSAFYSTRLLPENNILDLSNVTSIGANAFTNSVLSNATVVLNNSLAEIPNYCFNGTRIGAVNIPNALTILGKNAFAKCDQIQVLDFSNSQLSSIGSEAFKGMSNLQSILLPARSIQINMYNTFKDDVLLSSVDFSNVILCPTSENGGEDEGTFAGCTSLTSVKIKLGPIGTTTRTDYPSFNGCTALSSVQITTSGALLYKTSYQGFHNCDALTSFNFEGYIIDDYTFDDCTLLNTITLSSRTNDIQSNAFRNCVNISNFVCMSTLPPNIGGSATFANMGTSVTGPKYFTIPASAEAAYRANANWMYLVDTLGYTLQLV